MEDLRAFHARVDGFTADSLPHDGWLKTSAGLDAKVNEHGAFRPFYGNTVIYELEDRVKLSLTERQILLHHACGYCMAHPISPDTFHLTLHDLVNGTDEEQVSVRIRETENKAKELLNDLECKRRPIRMMSTHVFSMVNTSVVMGFAPEGEEDCRWLMEMYEAFHSIVPLNYGLTPHVTLGYYKPGEYGQDTIWRLENVFSEAEKMEKIHLLLSPEMLMYRTFYDMNHYT